MSEWREIKFEEIFDIPLRNGLTKPSKIRGKGIRMVNMKEIFAYDKIDDTTPMELVPTTDKEKVTLLKYDDLLFARQSLTEAGAGKISIFKGSSETVFESHLIRVRIDKSIAVPDFVYYYWKSPIGKGTIGTIVTQTAAAGIKGSVLQTLPIPIPSLEEQRAIASVLSSLDDKIDLLHSQNETLEKMAETLFRQWFVEEADDSWEEGVLGDVIEIFDNKRVPLSKMQRNKMKDGQLYPYYGAASIMDYVNDYLFDGEYILLGEDGTVRTDEGYPVLQYATGKFWVNNHAHIIRAIEPYNNFFIWNYLSKKNIDRIVTGAVQPKINQGNLKSLDFPKFPEKLVNEFNEYAHPFFQKINKNRTQIRSLTALRDTLLPKLMSGEVRVNYE